MSLRLSVSQKFNGPFKEYLCAKTSGRIVVFGQFDPKYFQQRLSNQSYVSSERLLKKAMKPPRRIATIVIAFSLILSVYRAIKSRT